MKYFLFIFVIFFTSKVVFAQQFEFKITTSNFRGVTIIDSTIQSNTYESVYRFHWEKFYSNHDEFNLLNGNVIKVHSYSDSTILFEEFDSTKILLNSGELVVDSSKTSIIQSDIPLTDDNGDPIIDEAGNWMFPADTSYYLVPNELWYFYLDNYKYALVNYNKGVKQGYSYTKLNSACLSDSFFISKILFENGIEKSVNKFLIPSQKELTKMIGGYWYHPACLDYIYYENPIWIFQRNKPNTVPRDGMFSSTFNKGGNYVGKMNYSCGTGRSKEDYYPKCNWKLEENGILEIGASKYFVLYITKDIMVLKEIE